MPYGTNIFLNTNAVSFLKKKYFNLLGIQYQSICWYKEKKKLERNLIIPSNGVQTNKNGGFTWFSREIYNLRSIRTLKGVSPNKRIHLWIPFPKSAYMNAGRPVSLSIKSRLEERWELLMKNEVLQREYEYKSQYKHIAENYQNFLTYKGIHSTTSLLKPYLEDHNNNGIH